MERSRPPCRAMEGSAARGIRNFTSGLAVSRNTVRVAGQAINSRKESPTGHFMCPIVFPVLEAASELESG